MKNCDVLGIDSYPWHSTSATMVLTDEPRHVCGVSFDLIFDNNLFAKSATEE